MAILALLLAGIAPAAGAQFGRNKLQHRIFDFHVLRTAHFDVYYYSEERERASGPTF